jgi:hypothetical protein
VIAPTTAKTPPKHASMVPLPHHHRRRVTLWTATYLALACGVLLVGVSYRLAAEGRDPNLYYAAFWIGMVTLVAPLSVWAASAGSRRIDRWWAIALLGTLTMIPKYLRNPTGPLYHDEYAHWREAVDVLSTGNLYQHNTIIPVIEYFPGTSALAAAIAWLTGLSPWSAGELLVCVAHVLALFAVFVLVEAHLGSARAGAVGALIYALNPSAIYFDTQYAYESVAITYFLWVLALGTLAARSDARARRVGLLAAAVLCGALCVVTHHLTTLALLLVLATTCAVVTVRTGFRAAPETRIGVWWALFASITAISALWLAFVAWPTVSYLSPYVGKSISQLHNVAESRGGGRELLAANVQPHWERAITALAPLVVTVVAVLGLVILRRQRGRWRSDTLALIGFGLVYFPSVPFVLTPSGAEGARRSWAFTYVGIAVVFGLVAVSKRSLPGWAVRLYAPTAMATLLVVLIGNVGAGLNDPYRFPGPFLWGSDTRSSSKEARTVAEQLRLYEGRVRVVADRYTSLALTAYGELYIANPSDVYPVWDLTQTHSDPSPKLAGDMIGATDNYLVVDVRMADNPAFNGDNFGDGDPLTGKPTPRANLERLNWVPWATLIMSTDHLRVYRLDLADIGTPTRGLG